MMFCHVQVLIGHLSIDAQGDALCKECFFLCFETEMHETIVRGRLFKRGMQVAIGASGGKGTT